MDCESCIWLLVGDLKLSDCLARILRPEALDDSDCRFYHLWK